jgi:DNA-binding GntR family transcriptional regulator
MRFVPMFMPGIAESVLLAAEDKEPPKAKQPTEIAYHSLRLMFFKNEIAPGQKISTTELAERFHMSPTPIVQALKWLEMQGMVRHEHNKGYYTEKCTLKEIQEIYELRETLEPSLMPDIIANLTDANLAYLKEALNAHLESLNQNILTIRSLTDMEFHFALASISGKETHMNFLKNLFDLLYLKYRNRNLFYEPLKTSGPDHLQIYEFVSQKNMRQASLALKRHIQNIKNHAVKCLKTYSDVT